MKKILAIDDNPRVLMLVEKFIQLFFRNFKIIKAVSAREGLELALKEAPDVVLLDIILPDMDGYEVCKIIKVTERTRETPVIFISSVDDTSENKIKALEAGADAFLKKPIEKTEFQLQLKAMLKIKESMDNKKNEKIRLKNLIEKRTHELEKELEKRIQIEKALRESEERYRFIVENQNDLVVNISTDHKLLFANPKYCETFGLSENEVAGHSFFPFIHEDDLPKVKKSIQSLANEPYQSYHEERAKTVNGWRWFGWSLNALVDDKKHITKIVSIGRDITDRKQWEQTLLENESKLKELNATKDKFFRIIAHDLRAPLNGLIGLSDLILANSNAGNLSDIQKMSKLLNRVANQYFVFLNNLLEWAQMQSGKKTFNPSELNLKKTCKELTKLFFLPARDKNISLHVNCPDLSIYADPNMLKTVIRNLISNALKYTYPGGTIDITAQQTDNELQISVKDNGIGMDENLQKKLFKIGEDITLQGTGNEKGTGLGLILCKEFIELHEGKIWVESTKGKGSVFYISLPLKNVHGKE